jgi:hypothetical protein
MQEARLIGARLQVKRLFRTRLQGAQLFRARFQGARLERAQFQGASLVEARLQGAWLDGARLQGAWLFGARLQGALLFRARLQGAQLLGARLQGARLFEIAIDAATDLTTHSNSGSAVRMTSYAHCIVPPRFFEEAFGDGSVKGLPDGYVAGEPPLEHWARETLDSSEFGERWHAWQIEIGSRKPDAAEE